MENWRDPDAYAHYRTLTLHQWAWEFLRRAPEYLSDWRKFVDGTTGDKEKDWRTGVELGRPWGLHRLYDPSIPSTGGRIDFRDAVDVSISMNWSGDGLVVDGVRWLDQPMHFVLRFSLLAPIEPQLKVADRILKHFRKKLVDRGIKVLRRKGKPQPSKFLDYVRALDARAAGASYQEIGNTLFPDSFGPRDKARDTVKAARRMASAGYRDLLLTPDTWHRIGG